MSKCHWPQFLLPNCSTLWNVFLFKISFRTSKLLINMLIGFLSFFLSFFISFFLPIFLSSFLSFFLPIFLSSFLSFFLSFFHSSLHSSYLPFFLPIFLSSFLSFFLSFFHSSLLSSYLPFFLPIFLLPSFLSSYLSFFLSFFLSSYLFSFLSFFLPSFLSFLLWPLLPTHRSVQGYCCIWRQTHYTRYDSPGRRIGPYQRPLPAPHISFTRDKRPCPRRGIRTRNPSKPADATTRLRPRDHRDGPVSISRTWKPQMNFIPIRSTEAFHFPDPLFRPNMFNLSTLRLSRCLLNHLIRSISASLVSRTRILSIPFSTNRLIYPEQPANATTVLSHCLPS